VGKNNIKKKVSVYCYENQLFHKINEDNSVTRFKIRIADTGEQTLDIILHAPEGIPVYAYGLSHRHEHFH
jgi:hypothetical protein